MFHHQPEMKILELEMKQIKMKLLAKVNIVTRDIHSLIKVKHHHPSPSSSANLNFIWVFQNIKNSILFLTHEMNESARYYLRLAICDVTSCCVMMILLNFNLIRMLWKLFQYLLKRKKKNLRHAICLRRSKNQQISFFDSQIDS